MRRAGEDAVRAKAVFGDFTTNLNGLIESKKLRKGKLASDSNIAERTLLRIRSEEDYIPNFQTLIALCLSMRLSFSESMLLIDMSPYRLRRTYFQDGVYSHLLISNYKMSLDEINLCLDELGCERLGGPL